MVACPNEKETQLCHTIVLIPASILSRVDLNQHTIMLRTQKKIINKAKSSAMLGGTDKENNTLYEGTVKVKDGTKAHGLAFPG